MNGSDALREAAHALLDGEGPDLMEGSDDAYADWLLQRAQRLEEAQA